MSRVHIIGAGLAGLAAATALAEQGTPVTLYEAGPVAGGRCRSYFDRVLECRIDNGNHLLLSGNRDAARYLARSGASPTMVGPERARFAFLDLGSGERWNITPNAGPIPWWVLCPSRRVAGTHAADYLVLHRLLRARPGDTVAGILGRSGELYARLLAPLAIAALTTMPEEAAATLLAAVLRETLMRGGRACRPLVPRQGLSESFVDPALAFLAARDAILRPSCRIGALVIQGGRIIALAGPNGPIDLAAADRVALAVPPQVAAALVPGLIVPDRYEAILNLHFRLAAAPATPGFIGLVGGFAEWVFTRREVASVTISAANRWQDVEDDALAARVWPEVAAALGEAGPMPRLRVVREKRATFAATPAMASRRPGARTSLTNLVLAGDWTATGLPATIEGAIRSGHHAANLISTLT